MTKFGLLGAAAAVLSSALASPTMAQQVIYNPGYCASSIQTPIARTLDRAIRTPAISSARLPTGNGGAWDNRHDSGFWPGDVAAGVVGGWNYMARLQELVSRL